MYNAQTKILDITNSKIHLENNRIDVIIGLKLEYTSKIGHNLANILK